jgi:deoxyadenosine/deoxycytidine kinase
MSSYEDLVTKLTKRVEWYYMLDEVLVVVVDGAIGVGKTTLIDRLSHSIKSILPSLQISIVGENVDDEEGMQLLEKYLSDPYTYAYDFQLNAVLSKVKNYEIALKACDKDHPTILFVDRDISTDKKVFFNVCVEKGYIPKHRKAEYKKAIVEAVVDEDNEYRPYKSVSRLIAPDMSIYVVTPVDECIHRIGVRGRKCESAYSREYLEDITRRYEDHYNKRKVIRFVNISQ